MRAHRRSKAASFIRCNGLTRSVLLWAHCERARFFRKLPGDTPRRVAPAGSTLVFIVAEMTTESRASPRGLSLTSLRRGINVNGESSRSLVAGDQWLSRYLRGPDTTGVHDSSLKSRGLSSYRHYEETVSYLKEIKPCLQRGGANHVGSHRLTRLYATFNYASRTPCGSARSGEQRSHPLRCATANGTFPCRTRPVQR